MQFVITAFTIIHWVKPAWLAEPGLLPLKLFKNQLKTTLTTGRAIFTRSFATF